MDSELALVIRLGRHRSGQHASQTPFVWAECCKTGEGTSSLARQTLSRIVGRNNDSSASSRSCNRRKPLTLPVTVVIDGRLSGDHRWADQYRRNFAQTAHISAGPLQLTAAQSEALYSDQSYVHSGSLETTQHTSKGGERSDCLTLVPFSLSLSTVLFLFYNKSALLAGRLVGQQSDVSEKLSASPSSSSSFVSVDNDWQATSTTLSTSSA